MIYITKDNIDIISKNQNVINLVNKCLDQGQVLVAVTDRNVGSFVCNWELGQVQRIKSEREIRFTGNDAIQIMNAIQIHVKRMMFNEEEVLSKDGQPITVAAAISIITYGRSKKGPINNTYVYVFEDQTHNVTIYNDESQGVDDFIQITERLKLFVKIRKWVDLSLIGEKLNDRF